MFTIVHNCLKLVVRIKYKSFAISYYTKSIIGHTFSGSDLIQDLLVFKNVKILLTFLYKILFSSISLY